MQASCWHFLDYQSSWDSDSIMPRMGYSAERKMMPSQHFSGCLQLNVPCGKECDGLRRTNRKEPRLPGFTLCIKLVTATKQEEEIKGLWKETLLTWFELTSLSGTDHIP